MLAFFIEYVIIKKDYRSIFRMQVNDKWIGIEQAADYLDIKVVTLRKWIKEEKVPCHKVGKLWKFKISELDTWVKSGKSAI